MRAEVYLDRDTCVHRLDPRTKLALMAASFLTACYFEDPRWVLGIAAAVVAHAAAARAAPNLLSLRSILGMLAVSSLVLWNFFARGATPVFGWLSVEGLLFSAGRALMAVTVAVAGVTFLSTTRIEEVVIGLIRLGVPYRVGFAVSTAMRLAPTLVAGAALVAQAQRSRGHDVEQGGVLRRLRAYMALLVPVFIGALRGTQALGMALESRAFGARQRRTYYLDPRLRAADYGVLVALLAAVAALTWLRLAGWGGIAGLERR